MSNMIKKVSRDHENYEVNSADKIMVYNRLGKLYTDEDLKDQWYSCDFDYYNGEKLTVYKIDKEIDKTIE